jgi:hypothetical protein
VGPADTGASVFAAVHTTGEIEVISAGDDVSERVATWT